MPAQGRLPKEATMNSTEAVARSTFQIVEISLWFALRSIMMRKLLRQVTIVAFMSLSLVSASSADNAKAQRSTIAHPTKTNLSARLALDGEAIRFTNAHPLGLKVLDN